MSHLILVAEAELARSLWLLHRGHTTSTISAYFLSIQLLTRTFPDFNS